MSRARIPKRDLRRPFARSELKDSAADCGEDVERNAVGTVMDTPGGKCSGAVTCEIVPRHVVATFKPQSLASVQDPI